MKLFTGWVALAGLVLGTAGAQAQSRAPYEAGPPSFRAVSDFGEPYAPIPPRAGPVLMPPAEVYTVLRENGFSPLGIPRQRGFVYMIAVVDRGGENGRLVIDARNGRIVRFLPAHRMGDGYNDDLTMNDGPIGPLAPTHVRGAPRPPGLVPNVASRTVPLPKASPLATRPAPEPVQRSAAAKPAETQPAPPAIAATVGQALSVPPPPQPTQDMPKVQGLE